MTSQNVKKVLSVETWGLCERQEEKPGPTYERLVFATKSLLETCLYLNKYLTLSRRILVRQWCDNNVTQTCTQRGVKVGVQAAVFHNFRNSQSALADRNISAAQRSLYIRGQGLITNLRTQYLLIFSCLAAAAKKKQKKKQNESVD